MEVKTPAASSSSAAAASSSSNAPSASPMAASRGANAHKLTKEVLHRFAIGIVHKDNTDRINAMDFSERGDWLITSSDDESLHLYSTTDAGMKKTIYSKKYGVDLVRFTHHPNAVLVASKNTAWDESIRYLSLHDNKFLRYFKGHRNRVVSLSLSPVDDTFLSGSLDQTVRLWDLRANAPQGLVRVKGKPALSHDPNGMIFGLATSGSEVRLYDAQSYDKGPFATFQVDTSVGGAAGSSSDGVEWNYLKFSPDGKHILLACNTNRLYLVDSFTGQQVQLFNSHSNEGNLSLEASFSPDGQFVLSGSEDGSVHVWEVATGKRHCVWKGHSGPTFRVQWCPTKLMVASASTDLAFWLPELEAPGSRLGEDTLLVRSKER